MPTQTLTVPADSDDTRLDRFLASALAVSRSQLQRLIKQGSVLVAGRAAKANQAVKSGQEISIEVPELIDAAPAPEALPLPIVYQDRDLIVVDKPAGMVVHPAAGHASGTLVNALLHHVDDLSGIGGEKRPGIVHRLDKGTSGLMGVAKHDRSHEELARQFAQREVEKEYLALAWGEVMAGRRIDAAIGRDPDNRKKMASESDRGGAPGAGRDACCPGGTLRPRADAGPGRHPHGPHAPDPRPPERDRASDRRRRALRRRAPARPRRHSRGHASRSAVPAFGAARVHASGGRPADGVPQRDARVSAKGARRAAREVQRRSSRRRGAAHPHAVERRFSRADPQREGLAGGTRSARALPSGPVARR